MSNAPNRRPPTDPDRLALGVALLAVLLAAFALSPRPAHGQAESFLPSHGRPSAAARLELRRDAAVAGPEVTLRQVCRWSPSDDAALAPVAGLVIARLGDAAPTGTVRVADVRAALAGAGFNLSAVNFAGATACDVRWTGASATGDPRSPDVPPARPASAGGWDAPTAPPPAEAGRAGGAVGEPGASRPATLRDRLVADLADRLGVPVDALQVDFDDADAKLLGLTDAAYDFAVEGRRAWGLGRVSWSVTLTPATAGESTDAVAAEAARRLTGRGERTGAASQRVSVRATARAWQEQLVVNRPMAARQVVGADDLDRRRVLVDRLDDPAATERQAVGQQVARALAPGSVLTTGDLEAVRLAKPGQFVTVTLVEGAVRVKTVVRAMDAGCLGQSIRVRDENTRDVFTATLTGPQTAVVGGGAIEPNAIVASVE